MMYRDCDTECKAHEHPTKVGMHLASCGVATGGAEILGRRLSAGWVEGLVDHHGRTHHAIKFEGGQVYAWVNGSWMPVLSAVDYATWREC